MTPELFSRMTGSPGLWNALIVFFEQPTNKTVVVIDRLQHADGTKLGGRWSRWAGGRYTQGIYHCKVVGTFKNRSLWAGGRYIEVVAMAGSTVTVYFNNY